MDSKKLEFSEAFGSILFIYIYIFIYIHSHSHFKFRWVGSQTSPVPVCMFLPGLLGCIAASTSPTISTGSRSLWRRRTPAAPSCCPCCCWPWSAPGWWAATLSAKPSSTSSTPGWRWRTTAATTCPGLCTDCCPSWEDPPTTKTTMYSSVATMPPISPTGTGSLAPTTQRWRSIMNVSKGRKEKCQHKGGIMIIMLLE